MRRPYVVIVCIILLLCCSSCIGSYQARKDVAELRQYAMEEFVKYGLEDSIGENVEIIKMRLGRPNSEEVSDVVNKHNPNQIDKIYKLTYYGMEVVVYHVNYEVPYDLIIGIVVTNDKFTPLKFGIKLGNNRSDIIGKFGAPTKEDDNVITYQIEHGDTSPTAHFYFDNDLLTKIHWEWYPD